jgi:hypothetical protein
MSGRKLFKYGIASLALMGAAMAAAPASATVITFDLTTTLEGTTPTGFPTITFDDEGTAGSVNLTIDATGLSGSEFISRIFFNFADAATASDLTFTRTGGTGPSGGFTIFQDSDSRNSPGNNGLFDIEIAFQTNNTGGNRFAADEILTFSITGEGITAGDFNVDSAPEGPDDDTNFAIARIQGIVGGEGSASVGDGDGGGGGGGGIPVPEPAAIGLFGLGLMAVGLGRRRKRA